MRAGFSLGGSAVLDNKINEKLLRKACEARVNKLSVICDPFAAKYAVALLYIAESQPKVTLENRLWCLLSNLLLQFNASPAQPSMWRLVSQKRVVE